MHGVSGGLGREVGGSLEHIVALLVADAVPPEHNPFAHLQRFHIEPEFKLAFHVLDEWQYTLFQKLPRGLAGLGVSPAMLSGAASEFIQAQVTHGLLHLVGNPFDFDFAEERLGYLLGLRSELSVSDKKTPKDGLRLLGSEPVQNQRLLR